MFQDFRTERIFLTVKAYPTFSKKHGEACCMAGITESGNWIRLYPVPFRRLNVDQKFKKYSWITARVKKSTKDSRAESYVVDTDSIQIDEEVPSTKWQVRNNIILPKVVSSEHVFQEDRDKSCNTLTLIRPMKIIGLEIDQTPDNEFYKQVNNLNNYQSQLDMFEEDSLKPIELIPYSFRYEFKDDLGNTHKMKIVDWEIYQLYRKYEHKDWKSAIIQKYKDELPKKELHFFLGTTHLYATWIIIGLYYPPTTVSQPSFDMFNG